MTDDLKFIVAEVNKILKADYNLISFDSLSTENLLQILLDVLEKLGAASKFEVKESDPADTNKYILDALKKIQYRPANKDDDPTAFRRLLLQGDKKTIYPILQYILKNSEKVTNLAYLSRYLIPITLPPEAMANPDIANLWSEYHLILTDFKDAHKAHSDSRKESDQFKELRNDIGIIDTEKENVRKRLERTQSRLDKINQQDLLLETAHALRVERDRQKELQSQLELQRQSVQKATSAQDRLVKELNSAQTASQDAAPQYLLQALLEETEVARFMVQQKLPQEMSSKKAEIRILEETLNHPSISREYLNDLQEQIDKIGADVRKMLDHQLAERGNQTDNLLPFRQQASTVARNKNMAAEQLDQITKELRYVEGQIRQKQELLNESVGGTILRGEELKQYINMLRAKSSVYKQKRAELAALKAEASDLQQTLDNLKQQDPTLMFPVDGEQDDSNDSIISRPESPIEHRGVTEIARYVDGLTRAVLAARERVTPLSQQIGQLRLKSIDLKEQRDLKKQSYNALNTTLTAEMAVMQSDVSEAEKTVKKLETTWHDLKTEYNRIEQLLVKATGEQNDSKVGSSLKESLTYQIREQEELAESLIEENRIINTENGSSEKQHEMWADLNTLLKAKLECLREAKQIGAGGTLFVQKGAETFTLQ